MASPQSTASGDAPKNNLEQITFRFCSECSNMLYPKEDEDSHKLMFTCRTCQYTEEATSSCVFRHVLNSAAGETAGVTQDVGSDPTVCRPVSSHPHAHRAAATTATVVAAPATSTATVTATVSATTATTAVVVDSSLALCLRCGITLLHCARCKDPASVGEYNECVLRNPDFTVHQSLRYVQFTNYWKSLDSEDRAVVEGRFASSSGLKMPRSTDESIVQYLPLEMALDSEADPPEALGVEPSIDDLYDTAG
ncbi:hypothetical protein F5B22DRAFT_16547 [Xylaria bambusicola]|uniref:uncharacterized protein n=1 Tax=Xylaria bambusicola TaxID=326684 RepID=UPI002007B3BC|nr:uncharacterized protein F5B22DRAFT_16547 [Xylaria bambusicola]KAI0528034.1 hypothetical protein F5B22DRAFT_16547 [Xylaria bambusicola]